MTRYRSGRVGSAQLDSCAWTQPGTWKAAANRAVRLSIARRNHAPVLLAAFAALALTARTASAQTPISQAAWTLHAVDSQDPSAGGIYAAVKAFDGSASTFWVTEWSAAQPPPPHEIQINLGGAHSVTGFRYLPRQDAPYGRIAGYEFYVSSDGVNWGAPVATGTFPDTTVEQQVLFSVRSGRYVRLRALSEVGGRPFTAVAELNVLTGGTPPPADETIPQSNWVLHGLDSEDPSGGGIYAGVKAFDGNATTFWVTEWLAAQPPPPHEIRVDLGSAYAVSGFRYLPRQDSAVGRIAQYELYVSTDGVSWGSPVATGVFPNTAAEQQVLFTARTVRYVRLRALSEVGGRPYSAVAELNVLGSGNSPPDGVITSPATDVTISPGGSVSFDATGTDPDNHLPLSYSWNFGTGGPPPSNVKTPGAVVFPNAGIYVVTLTVTDAQGKADPTPATRVINVGATGSAILPRTNWTVHYVDSADASGGGIYAATGAFDGNANSFWVTEWSTGVAPLPHDLQISLGGSYVINGLRYLPRQDATYGRIAQYEVYVSQDGISWQAPVATGTFANTTAQQEVQFPARTGRYIWLRATSEVGGLPYTAVAEINLLGTVASGGSNAPPDGTITAPAGNVTISAGQSVTFAATGVDSDNHLPLSYQWSFGTGGPPGSSAQNPGAVTFPQPGVYVVTLTVVDALGAADPTPATRTITVEGSAAGVSLVPQSNWSLLSVSSEETQFLNGSGWNAFDGNPNTSWVTQFTNGGPSPPHEIRIDLGASYELGGFRYLPHQAFQAGRVGDYAFYVSADGTNWGTPVAAGAFPDTNSGAARDVFFSSKIGRYVRLVALSEVHAGVYNFAAVGELNVFALTGTNTAPTATIVAPAQDVTVRAGTALLLSGTGSDPDGHTPLTYRWSVAGGAGIVDENLAQPGHVEFAIAGTFPVTFTVTDALGKSTAATRTVTVLGGTPACSEPSIVLTSPRSLHLQTTNTLQLTADACVSAGQGVRFVVDGVGVTDFVAPFAAAAEVARGEHLVEAYIVDGSNIPVAGVATYDRAVRVGYGDYYVATGDGMTIGFGDDKPDDDNSQDGRSVLGGYASVLADGLTAARGYPVKVAVDAISGGASADGAATIGSVLARHPAAQYVMVLWGHNDAEDLVPSGLGLMPPNPGYAGSFKANIQAIITAVQAAGKTPLLAKSPPILPINGEWDLRIQQYNQVLDELAAQNALPVPPADFYSHFANLTATHYQDAILLNGVGYEAMGQVWVQVLD